MLMKLSTGSAPSVASNKPTCDMALLRYRYYNQSVGRFTSFDDFAGHSTHPQSLNKYGYANGDPINVFDPSGHDGISFETLAVLGITSSFMFGWAYFTGHRTIETDFRPNWADAVGDVAHSHHRVTLAFPQTKLT